MARIMAELGGFHSLEDKANYDCEKGGGLLFEEEKKYVKNRRHAIESCDDYGKLFCKFICFCK
jgi:hypothetical protein